MERDAGGLPIRVRVSARTGHGLETLAAAIAQRCGALRVRRRLRIPAAAGRLRARLFALGAVTGEFTDRDGTSVLDVSIPPAELERLARHEGLLDHMIEPSSVGSGADGAAVAVPGAK